MRHTIFLRTCIFFLPLASLASAQMAASRSNDSELNLAGFRTVATATRAREAAPSSRTVVRTGYLGVFCSPHKDGLRIDEIDADGPGAASGLAVGDFIQSLNGKKVTSQDQLKEAVQAHGAGNSMKIAVRRGNRRMDVTAMLAAVTRPMTLNEERAVLGIQLGEANDEGAPIRRVSPGSPAATAGLRTGDVVTKVEGAVLADTARLDAILSEKSGGETISITYLRSGQEAEAKAVLAPPPANPNSQTFSPRNIWKKDVFRLAVVRIEYPDVKHNEKVTTQDWHNSMFSTGTYNETSATGDRVFGSMNDYFREQSNGMFRVEGKVFDWVEVSRNRMDYSEGNGTGARSRGALFTEAMNKIIERDGPNALDNFDGVFFLFAGGRVNTVRGGIYWPHRSTTSFRGKSWPYFIVQEGGSRMTNISVLCHEFGHMLGLPDLYARPENPGSEGLGIWCAMSNQAGNGRPQHMSAWCKVQLGWLEPTVIDPTVAQKLILAPVNGSKTECYKVLVRPDGSEYLLLENRRRTGFDESLPAEGLLIWRIVGNKVILEESHGVEGPPGPRVFVNSVPFPSVSNTAYTPYTVPSSRAQLGGGLPVSITNIRKLPDGRVTFLIGYDFH